MTEPPQYTGPDRQNLDVVPSGIAGPAWITPGLLVLANLVPLLGVLLLSWDIGQIMLFYWSENLLVGGFNVLRILSYRQARALFLAAFFTLHYGGFCAAHGALLLSLFDYPQLATTASGSAFAALPLLGMLEPAVTTVLTSAPPLWLWGFGALAASHAASFLINFLLSNERATTSPGELMMTPYQRIMILHVVLVGGGIAVDALGAPLLLLVMLVAIKITIDLRAHLRERRQQSQPAQAA
ncbi:MAG: DUF6498-containing protein [Pseudomonadota bacterium]